jgi:hypothetical protein
MGFTVTSERQFTARLRVLVPVDGGHREEAFKARYRVLDTARIEDFDLQNGGKEASDEFLRAVIVDLFDLLGEDGQPITYNDEVRDQVINIPYARIALVQGYFDGVSKGRRGN